ncbi:MAG: hypothetical protein EOP84_01035 [Verrucomicrobiaceae bacterium]|nr:MAG: hypothetical protein EOP84_01035 [Verrucomicrobiaceae bacterium]
MKLNVKALLSAGSMLLAVESNAAVLAVNNIGSGPGDTLYASYDNLPMSSGVVTMGYFPAGITPTTLGELMDNIGNFTLVASAVVGQSVTLNGAAAGYAESSLMAAPGGLVPASGGLFGRNIYSIVSSASSLGAATAADYFALVLIGTFQDDTSFEKQYFSNPGAAGAQVILGSIGSITTTTPAGNGTYATLRMAVIPEPSVVLLGAGGALGLLGRRRN